MSETATAASVAPSTAPAKPKIKTITFGGTLADAKGGNLRFLGIVRKNGQVRISVTHYERDKDGKVKSSTRGASEMFDTVDEAKAAIERGMKVAQKAGWARRTAGGARSRPDAFSMSNLPAPKLK